MSKRKVMQMALNTFKYGCPLGYEKIIGLLEAELAKPKKLGELIEEALVKLKKPKKLRELLNEAYADADEVLRPRIAELEVQLADFDKLKLQLKNSKPVFWVGSNGGLMSDEIYQDWSKAYPEDAKYFSPLYRKEDL